MEDVLLIKDKIDALYTRVVNGDTDVLEELDNLLLQILKFDDLSNYQAEEIEFIVEMITAFTEKVNLIYDLLQIKKDNLLTVENLFDEFKKLEIKRFNIVNSYVMGMVKLSDINSFKEELFQFRNMLYAIPISDNNLLSIAKMKSKIQHFNTEVLEDEDILRQAYCNDN